MKVLIDTNVLVSAVLKDRDPEEVVLFVAGHSDCEWIVSSEIIEEYREVLSRKKFGLPEELLYKWFRLRIHFPLIQSYEQETPLQNI